MRLEGERRAGLFEKRASLWTRTCALQQKHACRLRPIIVWGGEERRGGALVMEVSSPPPGPPRPPARARHEEYLNNLLVYMSKQITVRARLVYV